MNKERIMELADVIEGRKLHNVGFNMSFFMSKNCNDIEMHPCGTAGCIGGWCKLVFGSTYGAPASVISNELGVDYDEAMEIAYPKLLDRERNRGGLLASPRQAATLLRNFAETGVVDWPKAMAQGD